MSNESWNESGKDQGTIKSDLTGVGSVATRTLEWKVLNPSASAKLVIAKIQNLFVALVNMDIFQMTLKLSLFIVDF